MSIPVSMQPSASLGQLKDATIDCVGAFGFRGRFISGSTLLIVIFSVSAPRIRAMISSGLSYRGTRCGTLSRLCLLLQKPFSNSYCVVPLPVRCTLLE